VLNIFKDGLRELNSIDHVEKRIFKDFFRTDAESRLRGPKLEQPDEQGN